MAELTTKELLMISLKQTGWTPSSIARKLSTNPSDVRRFLASKKAMGYILEEEEGTDSLVNSLYRDGAMALKNALKSTDQKVALQAAKLTFELLGKLKSHEDKDSSKITIQKVLNVVTAPVGEKELEQFSQYCQGPSAITGESIVDAELEDDDASKTLQ